MPHREADTAAGGDQGIGLAHRHVPRGRQVVAAHRRQPYAHAQQPVVHQHAASVSQGPEGHAASRGEQVQDPRDAPPPDIGERGGSDEAAGVELGRELVVLALGRRTHRVLAVDRVRAHRALIPAGPAMRLAPSAT